MKEKLLALYALQQLDSALDAIKRQYAALDRGQDERGRYETVKASHAETAAALKAAQFARQEADDERGRTETKRKSVETKLYSGSVSNPKELQMMQDEVEALERQNARLDEKLVTLNQDLEACRAREKAAKQTLSEAIAAYNAKASLAQTETTTLKAQAEALVAQRSAQFKEAQAVAADLLKRYDRLREVKHGVAVVVLEDGNACGGCKMGLARDTVQRIREDKTLVLCENCERMLLDKK